MWSAAWIYARRCHWLNLENSVRTGAGSYIAGKELGKGCSVVLR